MGYLTKYGSFWGMLPQTSGRIFWVAPSASYTLEGRTYSSSDDNDGLSPERAFRTLAYAVSATRSGAMTTGEVVVLLPGSHSSASTVTVTTAGLIITGIPGNVPDSNSRGPGGGKRNNSRLANTTTALPILTITATDVEVAWLHFAPPTQGIGIVNSISSDRTYIHDCTFKVAGTASTTAYSIEIGTAVTGVCEDVLIRNCYFISGGTGVSGANGPAIAALCTCYGLVIERSTFELQGTAAWAVAISQPSAGSLGMMVRDCDFIQPTSATTIITAAIDITGATVDGNTKVYRCFFDAGVDAIKASATPDAVAAESYVATTTAGVVTGSA